MNRILISILTISLVGSTAIGITMSYFSDIETSTDNSFAADTLDFTLKPKNTWNFPFTDMKPGDTTDSQIIKLVFKPGSSLPNHIELDVDVHDFNDPVSNNSMDDFLKQIKVDKMNFWNKTDLWGPTFPQIDKNADGNNDFYSLYDVIAAGVIENIPMSQETTLFRIILSLPPDLPDPDDNKYQGDSISIDFEFGAAQVAGQHVLIN